MVRFSVMDEFLAELGKDIDLVERKIVRVTALYKETKHVPLHHLYVVATYKAAGEIVRLETFCGQLMGITGHDQAPREKARQTSETLEQFCKDHGLEVRAGIYEKGEI